MSSDPTEDQGGHERHLAREMSLKRGHPPTEVPGYEPERFLGAGAYGEVWVARERNTGRRVAIKFYAHRGGLDWSLLSREVEKLAFLFADRYVVQLLGVGWDAEPPYYIMEYLERGSLDERLLQGPIPAAEAVGIFRDVAIGLRHAHGKGVLHCDLKPANVLLDQDGKPRLADFGQSRLSHEQSPALGTLFYMAPEQADLEATPDARWDVYALGTLLYCMLTGGPPHRTGEVVEEFQKTPHLPERLAQYREMIETSPTPTDHRKIRGVDRALGDIVDQCLVADPEKRYPNVQAVLEALDARDTRRAQRPMMILGAALPAMLLLVVTWFSWQGFNAAVQHSNMALTVRALQSNRFAARYVARTAGNELTRRFEAVEHVASSSQFQEALRETMADEELSGLLDHLHAGQLRERALPQDELDICRKKFQDHPARKAFERAFVALMPPNMIPLGEDRSNGVASWFFCDADGISLSRVPSSDTIGKGFAYRSYFHGDLTDKDEGWRPSAGEHLDKTKLSGVFPSKATKRWIVAVSTPVFAHSDDSSSDREFLGVIALTVEIGRFAELRSDGENSPGPSNGHDQCAVLVNRREDGNQGVIFQHPLFDQMSDPVDGLPEHFRDYRLANDDLPDRIEKQTNYIDPLAKDPSGRAYRRRWLAQMEPVLVRGEDTNLVVIVQESYDAAIGQTLIELKTDLLKRGGSAVLLIVLVMLSLWWFATRASVRS